MHHRRLVTFCSCEDMCACVDRLVATCGGTIHKTCTHIPVSIVDVDEAGEAALRADPRVVTVEPDRIVSICAETIPFGISRVHAPNAHARGILGDDVKLAIIDTGIDTDHPDLVANYKGGINFVTPGNPPEDDHSHGTHCAGIAAAVRDDAGIVGMAPQVQLYAVKAFNALGQGNTSDLILSYDWALTNGMHVTSNSYSADVELGSALETALNAAHDAGIIMVFAAGNVGLDGVGYPAKYVNAVAVGATDDLDQIADFSSVGPEVDIVAPGVNIYSTVLNGLYDFKSGTSMACPHVAGACALALSSGLTVEEVRARLVTTPVDLGTPGKDNVFGWGLLDIDSFMLDAKAVMRCAAMGMWM